MEPTLRAGVEKARAFAAREHRLFIGGEWVASAGRRTTEIRNPATGEVLARVPEADAADVDRAVVAARNAFRDPRWARMPAAERGRLLWRIGEAIRANADELAALESLN